MYYNGIDYINITTERQGRPMKERTRRKAPLGIIEIILGLILTILGIYTLTKPVAAASGYSLIFGAAAVLSGVRELFYFMFLEHKGGFAPKAALCAGVLSIAAGVLFALDLDGGSFALLFLLPFWVILFCVSRAVNLRELRYACSEILYRYLFAVYLIAAQLGIALLLSPILDFSNLQIGYITGVALIVLGNGSLVQAVRRLEKN